jgi:hypothetical protein
MAGRTLSGTHAAVGRFGPSPAVVWAVGVLAVLLVVTGGWWLLSERDRGDRCAVLELHLELAQMQVEMDLPSPEDKGRQEALNRLGEQVKVVCG